MQETGNLASKWARSEKRGVAVTGRLPFSTKSSAEEIINKKGGGGGLLVMNHEIRDRVWGWGGTFGEYVEKV